MKSKCDEGRRLQTARDGQELDPASASTLLQSMAVFILIMADCDANKILAMACLQVSAGQLSGVIEGRGRRGQHHHQVSTINQVSFF